MKVRNIINNNGYAVVNQFILEDSKKIDFQSYRSLVASYDKEARVLTLGKDWDYSMTTIKHLKRFINDETIFSYKSIKQFRKEIESNQKIKYDGEMV